MKHTITLAAAAVALAVGAGSAKAGCADPGTFKPGSPHTIPAVIAPNLNPPGSLSPSNRDNAALNVVGTWLVTYTSGGNPFGQAFIQWHDDGTEWENVNFPILGGNICVGSWQPVDTLHVFRRHLGWLYTDGNLTGYFIETETDRVPSRKAYSGVNDTRIFDLSGKLLAKVSGTSSAVRIYP